MKTWIALFRGINVGGNNGRSKLATKVKKYLGVVTTARKYRAVDKLLSLVET